jgi:hypothetical protein
MRSVLSKNTVTCLLPYFSTSMMGMTGKLESWDDLKAGTKFLKSLTPESRNDRVTGTTRMTGMIAAPVYC